MPRAKTCLSKEREARFLLKRILNTGGREREREGERERERERERDRVFVLEHIKDDKIDFRALPKHPRAPNLLGELLFL